MTKPLEIDAKKYLLDAGFIENQFIILENPYIYDFVEVFFVAEEKGIDYVLSDLVSSDFNNLLEIRKYHHKDDIFSAIITYKEE